MQTPILIIIFNRPDFAYRLFQVLEEIKPQKLYIVSDGPRTKEENTLVLESRRVFENIDWNCEVKRDYSEINTGLRKRISGGISWAFESEDQLIILEDDCIPHPDFFPFCETLLKKYQYDTRVMCINGCNLHPTLTIHNPNSYLFTKYAGSWGWATWKRAWELYDSELAGLKETIIYADYFYNLPYRNRSSHYWHFKLEKVKKGLIDSWAYRWIFSLWLNNGLAIVPRKNLIQNIGVDDRSTNTKRKLTYINLKTSNISMDEFKHPTYISANSEYDKWIENTIYSKSFFNRIKWVFRKLISSFIH